MKLSISNIAWTAPDDAAMYAFLQKTGYSGLEIAPTRIFAAAPYDQIEDAKRWAADLKEQYGLSVSSMQSICFGRDESIFGLKEERDALFDYVCKAIDFAQAVGCRNLVFGSPKNRIIGENQMDIAYDFFARLGHYAAAKNTVLALEPNPDIYGTNFINTTAQALEFVKNAGSDGLRVNVDWGTFLHNGESLVLFDGNWSWINHIHISEPYLEPIKPREIHKELAQLLRDNAYDRYVSIEMKNTGDIGLVQETASYLKEIFHAL